MVTVNHLYEDLGAISLDFNFYFLPLIFLMVVFLVLKITKVKYIGTKCSLLVWYFVRFDPLILLDPLIMWLGFALPTKSVPQPI